MKKIELEVDVDTTYSQFVTHLVSHFPNLSHLPLQVLPQKPISKRT